MSTSTSGSTWTGRTAAENTDWRSVAYGTGIFVAVGGFGNYRVMTSPDGINWSSRTASVTTNTWRAVTFGNNKFVAVAGSGTGTNDRVMTSSNGINWVTQTSAADSSWSSVVYGDVDGLFVAVADSGTAANRVMTSSNGINWTKQTAASNNNWSSVTYGLGLFVAVSTSGSNPRVMTSEDGISWTSRTAASSNSWKSVTFGNGYFVAVSDSGSNPRVMTSQNGINWTSKTAAENNSWYSVTYGLGRFVAVSVDGTNRVMTSDDNGNSWTARSAADANNWTSVTYSNDIYVAVAGGGTTNYVMTSGILVCVLGSSKVLMSDNTTKYIKDLKKGDIVIEDIKTNKTNTISRIIDFNIQNTELILIPKNRFGDNDDLYIMRKHPIWINNGKNRINPIDVSDTKKVMIENDTIYTLQFDTEGTFYANGIKIDSLSPYNKLYPLPKECFLDPSKYIENLVITNENFNDEVLKADVPVLVDFWAPWCGPCQMMKAVFKSLDEEFKGKLNFLKLDTEKDELLAMNFQIQGIPALVLVNNKKEIGRIVGYMGEDQLRAKINSIISKI